jgi:hypothetical protein
MLYQRLITTHDTNGNPRRLYAVYGANGRTQAIYEEGYRGVVTGIVAGMAELPTLHITPTEYRRLRQHDAYQGEPRGDRPERVEVAS